jgi:hypothetical protein
LGKSTIASASKLRLFFGATVRSDDSDLHLLVQGQASLRPHKLQGDPAVYDAYGIWYNCVPEAKSVPFIDGAAASFMQNFELHRGKRPGLSLVIPFPGDEITPDALIKAAVESCFHQITTNQLVVQVEDCELNAATIRVLADQHGLASLGRAIDLSAEVAKGKLEFAQPRGGDMLRQRLNADHFDQETLKKMRTRWSAGHTTAVRLPVSIRRKRFAPEAGEVHLYVRREQNTEYARETYVRGRVSFKRADVVGKVKLRQ